MRQSPDEHAPAFDSSDDLVPGAAGLCPDELRFTCLYDTHAARLRANRLVFELAAKLNPSIQVWRTFWRFSALHNSETRLPAEVCAAMADIIVVAHSGSGAPPVCDLLRSALRGQREQSNVALVSLRVRRPGEPSSATLRRSLQSLAAEQGIPFFSTEVSRLAFESSPARRR